MALAPLLPNKQPPQELIDKVMEMNLEWLPTLGCASLYYNDHDNVCNWQLKITTTNSLIQGLNPVGITPSSARSIAYALETAHQQGYGRGVAQTQSDFSERFKQLFRI